MVSRVALRDIMLSDRPEINDSAVNELKNGKA